MRIDAIIDSTGAYSCVACAKCTGRCPLAKASSELDRETPYSPRAVIADALSNSFDGLSDMVWQCLTCNACALKCPSDVDFPDFVRQVRTAIRSEDRDGQLRLCSGGGQISSVVNLMASKDLHQNRLEWTEGLDTVEEGDTLFFVGCLPYFDVVFQDLGKYTDIARSMVQIMNQCGTAPVVLADEVCCGHDKLWTGDEDVFLALAQKNAKLIKEKGIKKIVTTCPECYRTLSLDYPRVVDFDIEVVHSSEYIAENVAAGKLRFEKNGGPVKEVSYQDPCRLGKHMGKFDEPRSVIDAVPSVHLTEMAENRAQSACCGTSAFASCDKVREQIRIDRLSQAGSTLITACPKCQIHFRCTQHTNQTIDPAIQQIEVKDLVQLVAEEMVHGN